MVKGEMRLIPVPFPPKPFEPVPAHNYTAMGTGTPPVMSVGGVEQMLLIITPTKVNNMPP